MALKILPIAEALKKIYIKLGGDSAEVLDMSTTTELIQEIAELPLGGGGGGGNTLVVNSTPIMEDEEIVGYTLDKNYSEIKTALLNGMYIQGLQTTTYLEDGVSYYLLDLTYVEESPSENSYSVTLGGEVYISNSATGELIIMYN